MRWPWQRREAREAGGNYTDAITQAILAQASATVADTSATAAIEAAAGSLSRALAGATVEGPDWVRDAVDPVWLAQVGRSLIREGASLSVLRMARTGAVDLIPAAHWTFETLASNGEAERQWRARVTTYGPTDSVTRTVGRERLVFVRWGTSPGTRYRGRGPTSWAHLTAKLQGEAERSLADESAGPLAQLIPVPADGGDGGDGDPLAQLKADIGAARGKALVMETTAAGWGDGRASAPQRDWKAERLGPAPTEALVRLADQAFNRMLAACGVPPPLFLDSDGTSQREALRRWHMGTVVPIGRMLSRELSLRFEASVRLVFDGYPLDLQSRAATFQKLVAGGVSVNEALATSGLLIQEDS